VFGFVLASVARELICLFFEVDLTPTIGQPTKQPRGSLRADVLLRAQTCAATSRMLSLDQISALVGPIACLVSVLGLDRVTGSDSSVTDYNL